MKKPARSPRQLCCRLVSEHLRRTGVQAADSTWDRIENPCPRRDSFAMRHSARKDHRRPNTHSGRRIHLEPSRPKSIDRQESLSGPVERQIQWHWYSCAPDAQFRLELSRGQHPEPTPGLHCLERVQRMHHELVEQVRPLLPAKCCRDSATLWTSPAGGNPEGLSCKMECLSIGSQTIPRLWIRQLTGTCCRWASYQRASSRRFQSPSVS